MPKTIPCPFCFEPIDVGTTKKEKPWLMCYPCGVRIFVNGPQGIRILEKMIKAYEGNNKIAESWVKRLQKALEL